MPLIRTEKNSRKRLVFIKATVSVAFYFVLISFVQRNELITVFSGVNWFYLICSFVLAIIMLMVSCWKWKVLLDASGQRLSYLTLLRIYLIGYFFSNLLPSMIGGDVVRSFYVGRLINNQTVSATSVFLERFTGMLFLLLLVIFAPLLRPELYANPFVYIPAVAAACLLLLIVWIWKGGNTLLRIEKMMRWSVALLKSWLSRLNILWIQKLLLRVERIYLTVLKRLRKFQDELQTALRTIQSKKYMIFSLFILTAVFYFLTWVNVYVSFLAFGVQPGFLSTSALVPTIMLIGQLPVTLLGNLGFIESVFVFYFLQIQIPTASSLAMGLLLRVKLLCLGSIGYIVYLLLKRDKSSLFAKFGDPT